MTKHIYNMRSSALSLYMLAAAIFNIIVVIIVMKLTPKWNVSVRIGERFWMLFAFCVSSVGISLCYIGSTGYLTIKPSVLGEITFMFGQTISMSAYMMLSVSLMPLSSKIVPPYAKQMIIPWVNSWLALGRLSGPLWTNFSYSVQSYASTEFMFASILTILVLCTSLLLFFWKRMVADVWKIGGGSSVN